MCGIWAYILPNTVVNVTNESESESETRTGLSLDIRKQLIDTLVKRGPDRSKEFISENGAFHLAFHRLAIHDLSQSGDQPFTITDAIGNTYYLICNGEIYNYKSIISNFELEMKSNSDCEVIIQLCAREGMWENPLAIINELEGEFSFVAVRVTPSGEHSILVARDPYGVRPLYYAVNKDGSMIFSSLLYGIVKSCHFISQDPYDTNGSHDVPAENDYIGSGKHFPPGHYFSSSMSPLSSVSPITEVPALSTTITKYYKNVSESESKSVSESTIQVQMQDVDEQKIYMIDITKTLIDAVSTRLASDRDIGFFLSGGLDSSLVVGIAVKILGLQRAKTFSIGMEGSPDLEYARQVATFLGTDHTEVIFTEKDIIEALPQVIECLETYDITTVRASIGSFLLAKHIRKNTDVRVILNGDGSDEVACGYLYNYYAPSAQEAHLDAERLLEEIHMYDGLRVDRTISYHGLEARLPFLDPKYVHAYMSIPAELRIPTQDVYDADTGKKIAGRMEKYMLRIAFKKLYPYVLPESILMRRKEAFSNGVSGADNNKKSMIQIIKDWAFDNLLTEPVLYKAIFEVTFPNHLHVIPRYWMPRWCDAKDPSATVLSIYQQHDVETEKDKEKELEIKIKKDIESWYGWCWSLIVNCVGLLSSVTNWGTWWTRGTKQES